jgi:serine/threonine-protein kinase
MLEPGDTFDRDIDAAARADAKQRDAWLRQRRRAFYWHAGVYVIANLALLALTITLGRWVPLWYLWFPVIGPGIGVAIHGLMALTADEDDWKVHREGLRRKAKPRRRVAALPAERVRVAADAADTGRTRAAAEAEAALAEAREAERRKR